MAEYDTVLCETVDQVATITINRPDAMNSFDAALRADLASALRDAAFDDAVRVIVLTGTGRSFSAGADLNAGLSDGSYTVEEQLLIEYRPIFDAVTRMKKPIIAAINGSAAGVGLSLALACDMVIMSDKAFLLSPFTTISLVPDGGCNWLLVHQLGYKKAFELSILSERIPAQTALDLGLVNRMVPADELLAEAHKLAEQVASRAPQSVSATKKTMRFASNHSFNETFEMEAELQRQLVGSPDNVEGINAFLEKREPKFKG